MYLHPYVHTDPDALRVLTMTALVDIDPGQTARLGRDPDNCQPGWPRGVTGWEILAVLSVRLLRGDGSTRATLATADGSLSGDAADALAREFTARLQGDDRLRATVEAEWLQLSTD